MWKKIAIAGGTIALIVGTGSAALAASGSGSPTAGPSPSASASAGSKARPIARLRNLEHGSWVTRGKDGTDVTHTAFRGAASDVSATGITVTATDNAAQAFVIDANTKVHTKAQHQGASISAVQNGDTVIVVGTGTGPITATQVIDRSR